MGRREIMIRAEEWSWPVRIFVILCATCVLRIQTQIKMQ